MFRSELFASAGTRICTEHMEKQKIGRIIQRGEVMDSSLGLKDPLLITLSKKKKKFWVHPLLHIRDSKGRFQLIVEELKRPVPDVYQNVGGIVWGTLTDASD